jgi:hypothetical protein
MELGPQRVEPGGLGGERAAVPRDRGAVGVEPAAGVALGVAEGDGSSREGGVLVAVGAELSGVAPAGVGSLLRTGTGDVVRSRGDVRLAPADGIPLRGGCAPLPRWRGVRRRPR